VEPRPDVSDSHEPAVWPGRWFRSHLGSNQATHGIYSELMLLVVILALEGHASSVEHIVASVVGALVAVALTEVYADYIGAMILHGRKPSREELRASVMSTGGGLVSTLPPILLLMLGVSGVISLHDGFTAAKWAGVTVLALYAFVANRRAGLSTRRSLGAAAFLIVIAVGLVMLKYYYH
jgi:hypothetical protein